MKINAVIESKDGGTLVLDFPRSIYDVYEKLQSVGIRQSPHQVTLSDEDGDDVRVKLYSDDEIGKHLLLTLNERNSLADANMLAFMVDNAKPDFRSKLEQNLLHDQYGSMQEVTDAIKQMLYESGPVKAVFYCPLVGEVTDDEGFSSPVDGRFLKSYAWAVEKALEADTADDEMDMADFFDEDDGVKAKLVSAKWGVETYRGRLFGRIECSLKEELTDAETEILTDWISGQNSDGYGEYFEQQPIDTEDGDLYVSFWNSGDNYNISANVRWGKSQSAKEGNVPFHYKRFLGYRRGSDGKPEIDPEQAAVVKRIYERFLAGDSLATIANDLNADGIPTPSGIGQWQRGTIESILTNEKYKGDAILNKTYIRDCLSKKVMINNGERPKYYVENNHPAIIDSCTFGRVQEEMARRSGKRKVKQVGTKTEQGRYSSKYALTELLICGECGTPYRRCTWAANGKKKVVWRCINRLDYGKKYCHDSPSIEESVLQEAIMKAVLQTAKQNADVLKTLKLHIGMGLSAETTEDNSLDLQIRIAEVEAEFQKMLKAIAADNVEAFDEEKAKALMDEKAKLQIQLDRIADTKQKRENAKSRLDEIFTIIEALANHPISYDDQIVRQVLESVIVESKEKIKVVFVGGLEVTQLM